MGILCESPYCPDQETRTETKINIDSQDKSIPFPKLTISENQDSERSLHHNEHNEKINKIPEKSQIKQKSENAENQIDEKLNSFKRRMKSNVSKTVKQPIELQSKKLDNNEKPKENIKEETIEDTSKQFQESKNEIKKFIRKNKRTTTLMEQSRMIKRMSLEELNLPVTTDILVMHQKGKPTDRYRRGKLIGSGAFGSVYSAKNLIFNNMVAMKIIEKKESNTEKEDQEVLNEINILKKLSHPNIVKIYEFFDTQRYYYIITEFCKGGELFSYIRNQYTESQLSVLFYQVLSGLWYLHENKILHRDIKLENILISEKEKDLKTDEEYFWIKIIDFGTSKIFKKKKKESLVVGSAYYIAPEVLSHNYNEKCDMWSVGIILYMTLVGRAPFDGANDDEILHKIKNENYNKDEPKLKNCSLEVQDLVSKLLDKNVDERFNAKQAIEHPWFSKFNARKLFSNFKNEDIQPYIDNCLKYSFNSKIQSLVIAFLVHNLPNTESSKIILKMFRFFNKSGNCKLTKNELIEGLSNYRSKQEVTDRVNEIFLLLDSDNNGFIEFEEFLRACIDKKEVLTDVNMKFAFKFLDKNDTGTLNATKIMHAFLTQPNKLIEIVFQNTLSEVDDDGDGIIDYEQFKRLMLKTMEQ